MPKPLTEKATQALDNAKARFESGEDATFDLISTLHELIKVIDSLQKDAKRR